MDRSPHAASTRACLFARDFAVERRPAAYGLVAAAGAVAIALGPLMGGLATTYFSWRRVFAGEVVMVLGILLLARRITEAPIGERARIDGLWTPRVTGG